MRPITTAETTFDYRPDLPCVRRKVAGDPTIYTVWEPSASERRLIALGHNLRLGVQEIGKLPAVELEVTHLYDIDEEPA